MSAAPHLRLVNPETGEITECPSCAALQDQLVGLERDIRGWRARYADLKRDRDQEAKDHPLQDDAKAVFDLWRELCRHPGCKWTPDRFWLVAPFLEKYGRALCERAIRGAEFDPYITRRKNGSEKRHDGWELIFRDAGKFEEMANRAPRAPKGATSE